MLPSEDIFNSWTHFMRHGDFEAAWKISDIHLRQNSQGSSDHLPLHLRSVWDGSPLDQKRVLIQCYHGLGDTIQFIRYLPLVEKIASQSTVRLQPELIPLIATMNLKSHLTELTGPYSPADFDVEVELMELPFVFRTTLQSIPADIPYLHVPPDLTMSGPNRRPQVGVVWQAGDWDLGRSIRFTEFFRMMRTPNIEFHILQRGSGLAECPRQIATISGSDDPFITARIIKSLDLLISVDSMPAHLAGALGVPVWTLLQANADWRWMRDRTYSPWYPTMRLFRQNRTNDWRRVIDEVIAELTRIADRLKTQTDRFM